MPYAIVVVPVAPMRATTAHKSEMISQLLWGECVEITDSAPGGWVQVKNQYDGYTGWVTVAHLEEVEAELYTAPATGYMPGWINQVTMNGQRMVVPFGCLVKSDNTSSAKWGSIQVVFEDKPLILQPGLPETFTHLKDVALKFLNTAYLWGGKSVFGVDCSGFTQSVLKLMGIPVLRDAYEQATQGTVVDFLLEARLGDLAFFDNEEGRITHVGVLLNDHEIIHSSGKVRIDPIDNEGIIHADTRLRTHKLGIIKRYF
ncbi:C40 family peptidase [Chitinophaga sp. MM2321]|uniref:C40 family peptidase n=1 Tax=Chitinophaga sp. MM2321 TaxID=3137178 RepID=UPI0032D59ECA